MDQTSKLDLFLPDYPDEADVELLNDNARQLDKSVGITSVDSLNDITNPLKQQFAYMDGSLYFWVPQVNRWLLIATNDASSTNEKGIVLPYDTDQDVTLTSEKNPLQIGRKDQMNMAFDANEIQGRDGQGGPSVVAINTNGGHVTLGGPDKGLVEGEAGGVYIPSMVPKRDSISINVTDYRSSSWSAGGPAGDSNRCEIDIVAHYACRFMVFMTASVQCLSSSVEGVICLGSSMGPNYIDDPNTAPEERLVRFTGTHKQQVALNYFFDPTPVSTYRGKKINIAMYYKAAASVSAGQGFNIYTRRLHVLPIT